MKNGSEKTAESNHSPSAQASVLSDRIEEMKKRIRMCQPSHGAGYSERRANDQVRDILKSQLADLEEQLNSVRGASS